MLDREKFRWNVHLQGEDGQVTTRKVEAYWSPSKEGTEDAVKESAAAMAYVAGRKKMHYFPISAELIAA